MSDDNTRNSSTPHKPLLDCLLDRLDQVTARDLVTALIESGIADTVYDLLSELRETSSKIAGEAVWACPEFRRRCGLESVVSWLDLGISFTQFSGAIGLRYFKDSPLVLGVIDRHDHRKELLALTLELADNQSEFAPNCAFEFFKKAPELLLVVPALELGSWAEIGMELAQWDYVLGNEFLRESPSIARVVPHDQVRAWVGFGMKLVSQNRLGKTDYLGTLEFFRRSPSILGEITDPDARKWVVDLGSALADRSPHLASSFLADSANLFGAFPSSDWGLRVLKYALLIADRDPEATLAFVQRSSEILHVSGEAQNDIGVFESWFKGGMEVLEYSVEAGRAYFALESKKALASVEHAMSGVPLRQIVRSLKLFAQGLCGTDVTITALQEIPQKGTAPLSTLSASEQKLSRAKVSSDGKTIFLPALMQRASTREDNLRIYTVMTAHEAGHLEFGTYRVAMDRLQDLACVVRRRYTKMPQSQNIERVHSLGDLFALYPQKGVIRDLWEVLEDARVEYLLQREYPGLRNDLTHLTKEAVKTRSLLHGMTAREMVIDSLLLYFAGESSEVNIPQDLQEVVARAWSLAEAILRPDATAEQAIRLADHLYQILDEMVGTLVGVDQGEWREEEADMQSDFGPGPRAAEEVSGQYRPITNWAYRGAMDPDLVQGLSDSKEEMSGVQRAGIDEAGLIGSNHSSSQPVDRKEPSISNDQVDVDDVNQDSVFSPMEQWLEMEERPKDWQVLSQDSQRQVLYDEWDGTIRDYRPKWCRVVERIGQEGTPDFVDQTLSAHAAALKLLRRYFETIRPTALRRLGRQDNGEDIDFDAVVARIVDRRVGSEPSDRIYVRRDKRERQVAVAFLIDMSGSTGRQIGSGQRRVIDVEKEGLILLSEALAAIGDQYALFGYSGQGRGKVEVVVLKDFEDSSGGRAALRIGAITPLQQNRDGAAIRHAVNRLLQRAARTRLLVLLSDGKPVDDEYGDEYSLEDTKMALREARLKGIHPFCITIDQSASDYLRRMYGDVGFLVLDDVNMLPARLPRIYRRLTA